MFQRRERLLMFMRNEITEADHTNNVWNRYDFVSEVMGKRFIRPWRMVKYLKRSLKWSWQRIVRGFSDGDIWWMYDYLQVLFPDMLQHLKDHRMGSPVGLSHTDEPGDDSCHEEWDRILSQMIFLWRESYEYSSSRKNSYEEEYYGVLSEFYKKYEAPNKRIRMKNKDWKYKEISDKYEKEERELSQYREECKNKAMDMMKEYFYYLWD